jgi:hypothetical protein
MSAGLEGSSASREADSLLEGSCAGEEGRSSSSLTGMLVGSYSWIAAEVKKKVRLTRFRLGSGELVPERPLLKLIRVASGSWLRLRECMILFAMQHGNEEEWYESECNGANG